jgi:hypothetical protein
MIPTNELVDRYGMLAAFPNLVAHAVTDEAMRQHLDCIFVALRSNDRPFKADVGAGTSIYVHGVSRSLRTTTRIENAISAKPRAITSSFG